MSAWDIAGAIGWSTGALISFERACYLRWGSEREQLRLYPWELARATVMVFPAVFCIARLFGAHT